MNQLVRVMILGANTMREYIQLGLKDVDQKTGEYTSRADFAGNNNNYRGGPRPSSHQLQLRVKLRRETLLEATPMAVMTSSSGSILAM